MAQESGDLQAGRMECWNQPADPHAGFHFRGFRTHSCGIRTQSPPVPITPSARANEWTAAGARVDPTA